MAKHKKSSDENPETETEPTGTVAETGEAAAGYASDDEVDPVTAADRAATAEVDDEPSVEEQPASSGSDKVKVEITTTFTYRGKTFEKGKIYEVDPALIPGWVEHWIVAQGNGVTLPPESDIEGEPDPRTATPKPKDIESENGEPLTGDAKRESLNLPTSDDEGVVQTGRQSKITIPHPDSPGNLGDIPVGQADVTNPDAEQEGDDTVPERPHLGGPNEPINVTSSENVPSSLTSGGRSSRSK